MHMVHDWSAELERVKRQIDETVEQLVRARDCIGAHEGEAHEGTAKDVRNCFISLQLALEDSKTYAARLAQLST